MPGSVATGTPCIKARLTAGRRVLNMWIVQELLINITRYSKLNLIKTRFLLKVERDRSIVFLNKILYVM